MMMMQRDLVPRAQLLKELDHENVVKQVQTYLDHIARTVVIVFEYAEYDLQVCFKCR